jgi:hypothetical protein
MGDGGKKQRPIGVDEKVKIKKKKRAGRKRIAFVVQNRRVIVSRIGGMATKHYDRSKTVTNGIKMVALGPVSPGPRQNFDENALFLIEAFTCRQKRVLFPRKVYIDHWQCVKI